MRLYSNLLLSLPLLALLTACSNGSGAGDNGAPKINPREFVKPSSVGSFLSVQQAPLGDYGQIPLELPDQSRCSNRPLAYDIHLRPDLVFTESQASVTNETASSKTVKTQIVFVNATELETDVTESDVRVLPFVPLLPTTIKSMVDYKIDSDGEHPTAPSYVDWLDSKAILDRVAYKDCQESAKSVNSTITGTVQLGTYQMSDGTTVRAQRIVSTKANAEISCSTGKGETAIATDTASGHGTIVEETINTIDLISTVPSSCTPITRVYHKRTITLDDGTVLQSDQSEVLSAPKR